MARRRVTASRRDATPSPRHADVVRAFKHAWEAQNISALVALLAPDATATGDGGGFVTAELRPVEGAGPIARFYAARSVTALGMRLVERTVNGRPGLVVERGGATVSVMAFEICGDRIHRIWAVLNPAKLRPWRI